VRSLIRCTVREWIGSRSPPRAPRPDSRAITR
jgi:hypothetical protein